jgi:hypothetical protein
MSPQEGVSVPPNGIGSVAILHNRRVPIQCLSR